MRADAMLDKGDLDGYAVWKRILQAVEELQGAAPAPGPAQEVTHAPAGLPSRAPGGVGGAPPPSTPRVRSWTH